MQCIRGKAFFLLATCRNLREISDAANLLRTVFRGIELLVLADAHAGDEQWLALVASIGRGGCEDEDGDLKDLYVYT